jgi:formylmethanofuran dehydrogenase subunit E
MSLLEKLVYERRMQELKDRRTGLAYCNMCGKEYTNAEIVSIEDELSCPHCKKPETKTIYYLD